MKSNLICGAVLAAMFSASAGAQTCASPDASWHPNAAGSPDLSGSTCGHETGLVSVCESGFQAPAAAYIASITPQVGGTFTNISATGGAGYTISLYLVDAASTTPCDTVGGDGGHCQTSGDAGNPIAHANLTDGHTYFVIVTGGNLDTSGSCGNFNLHADGTLPVTLQNFTVS